MPTRSASDPRVGGSERQVRRVVLARLVSSTGAEAAFLLGLWGKAAFTFGGTPTDLAVMSALVGLAGVLGSVLGGVLVDRWDARRVVILAEVVFVPATLALVLATNIPQLLLLGIVSWLTAAALETAITSMPPALVAPEGLERANARLESANWLALVIGPALGAPLVALFGLDSVFVLDALTSVGAIVLLATVRLPTRPSTTEEHEDAPSSAWRDTVSGLRYAVTHRPVRTALYLGALPGLAFGMFIALEPLFYRDVVGTQVEVLGYVNAVFGFGLLVGSVVVSRSRGQLSTFRTTILLTVASGLGGMVYVITPWLPMVLVGAVLWSVPLGMVLPLVRTLAQRHADPAFVGRTMGAYGTASAAASLLPVVVAPSLARAFGVQTVLIVSAATAAIGAPLVWRVGRELDRRSPPPGGGEGGVEGDGRAGPVRTGAPPAAGLPIVLESETGVT